MKKMDYNDFKELLAKKGLQKRIDQLAKKYANKSILIYSGGLMSSVMFDNYDLSKLNIAGVADIKFFGVDEEFKGHKAISSYDIPENKPDVILLATLNSFDVKEFLKENIFPETGNIPVESILQKDLKEKFDEFLLKIYNSL